MYTSSYIRCCLVLLSNHGGKRLKSTEGYELHVTVHIAFALVPLSEIIFEPYYAPSRAFERIPNIRAPPFRV